MAADDTGRPGAALLDLVALMTRLRAECPWDAEQTHRSLAKHIIEETAEVIDAIEAGDDVDLREELGDVLLQVFFHAEIARTEGRFDIDDVARGITEKLIHRHPYIFASADVPDDMMDWWEALKREEKQRESVLEGIPDSLDTLARASKVVSRVSHVHLDLGLPTTPIAADEAGRQLLDLVARAQASDVDIDQAARDAVRAFEARVRGAEAPDGR